MPNPQRGGAAFGRMMATRVRELEEQRGAPLEPVALCARIQRHLVDESRNYYSSSVIRILNGKRDYPDAEEVHAWCAALGLTGAKRARAFWIVGLAPPELSEQDLATAIAAKNGSTELDFAYVFPARYRGTGDGGDGRRKARSGRSAHGQTHRPGQAKSGYPISAGHRFTRTRLPELRCAGRTPTRRLP